MASLESGGHFNFCFITPIKRNCLQKNVSPHFCQLPNFRMSYLDLVRPAHQPPFGVGWIGFRGGEENEAAPHFLSYLY